MLAPTSRKWPDASALQFQFNRVERRQRAKFVSRRQAPNVDESANYLFAIEDFSPSYSFGAGSNWQNTVHDEHLHTIVRAKCLAPEKYAGRLTSFSLMGDRNYERLMKAEAAAVKAAAVGTLTLRGKTSEYLGGLPFDALVQLQPLLIAHKFKYIWLTGARLIQGAAAISRISFDDEIEDEDLHLLGCR